MANQAPKKLVFLHIPKTAGSSVGQWLDAQFNEENIARIYSGNAKEQLAAALQNPKITFIRGHFGLYKPLLDVIDDPEVYVAIILREPVSRVLSLYNHMQRRQVAGHQARMKTVKTLTDFLQLKTDYNEQTRYLSGMQDKNQFQLNIETGFKQALQNAQKIDFIGFTETLDQDFARLCQQLGFPKNLIAHKNKGLGKLKQLFLRLLYAQKIADTEIWDNKLYHILKNKNL